jgi:hypothetical protein
MENYFKVHKWEHKFVQKTKQLKVRYEVSEEKFIGLNLSRLERNSE